MIRNLRNPRINEHKKWGIAKKSVSEDFLRVISRLWGRDNTIQFLSEARKADLV
jgi:hypothetical protein